MTSASMTSARPMTSRYGKERRKVGGIRYEARSLRFEAGSMRDDVSVDDVSEPDDVTVWKGKKESWGHTL